MRLKGIITEAKYVKGISSRTGNPYELTNYEFQHTDAEGHNHKLAFTIFAPDMYEKKVHKGDSVEVSVQLGLREYNGNKYNEVSGVYFVGKTGDTQSVQVRSAQIAAPKTVEPSAPVFHQTTAGKQETVLVGTGDDGLPF